MLERLTAERVERAKPGEFLVDAKVTGLMLRVGKLRRTWIIQCDVKDAETQTRKCVRATLGHYPELSLQQARDQATVELHKMKHGRNPQTVRNPKMTVKAAIEDFINGAMDLRPRSIQGYRYNLERYLKPLHQVPMSDLGSRPALVRDLFLKLSAKNGKATANSVVRLISAAYNEMRERNSDMPPNPVRRGVIRMHKLPRRKGCIPEDGFREWATALQTIRNPIRRAMRLFFLLTGQRDEAVRTMKWENVDFKRERIHYPEPKGGPEAAFDLPMSAPVKQVLEWVRTFSEADWAFPGSEWVWPTLEKESRQTTHVYTSREPGKPELRGAHDLRRTFITTGYEVASYKFISYLANHACKDSITDDYFNPQQEAVKNALETVDAAIISKLGVSVETLLGPQKLDTTAKFRASQANVA